MSRLKLALAMKWPGLAQVLTTADDTTLATILDLDKEAHDG